MGGGLQWMQRLEKTVQGSREEKRPPEKKLNTYKRRIIWERRLGYISNIIGNLGLR